MAIMWNALMDPLPQPKGFDPMPALNAFRQGREDYRVDRKDTALQTAGQRLTAGDTKGAQAALYGAGEVDAGFKIGQHQLAQAQHEMEVWQKVSKLAEHSTPEQWQQTQEMYRRIGVNLPKEYLDPVNGQALARTHAYDKASRLQQALIAAQTEQSRAHARLYGAQADQAAEKPGMTVHTVGPGQTLLGVPRTGPPVVLGQGGPEKAPPGYEPDPTAPGRLRPIGGGPADVIKGEEAARLALLTQAKAALPQIRSIYLGDDKTPPAVPFPTGAWAVTQGAAAQYGRFGQAGEGQRLIGLGAEGILRALTGAAATQDEIDRTMKTYAPSHMDAKETREHKIKLFEQSVNIMGGLITRGIPAADIKDAFMHGRLPELAAAAQQRPSVPGTFTSPPPQVNPAPARQRARNPQTGQVIEFDGEKWVEVR